MDLPLRETEITIEVEPGVRLLMEPLTDAQFMVVNESAIVDTEPCPACEGTRVVPGAGGKCPTCEGRGKVAVQIRWSMRPAAEFFADRFRGLDSDEPVTVGGAPFDRKNADHVARGIPQIWKSEALVKLFRYARGLDEEQVGN